MLQGLLCLALGLPSLPVHMALPHRAVLQIECVTLMPVRSYKVVSLPQLVQRHHQSLRLLILSFVVWAVTRLCPNTIPSFPVN